MATQDFIGRSLHRLLTVLALIGGVILLAACGAQGDTGGMTDRALRVSAAGTEPIRYGVDRCAYCDRPIEDERFGGELRTRDGTVYKFLSVECLAGFLLEKRVADEEIAGIWVVDFSQGTRLIEAREARYVRSERRPSPSGLNILPVRDQLRAVNLHFAFGGEILDFDQVLALVAETWKVG